MMSFCGIEIIVSNMTTVLSSLFISNKTNITNNVTIQSQLLSNNLNLQSNLTCSSNIAITNNINLNNLNIYAISFVHVYRKICVC